jgi:tRNA G18 (ribose-2'-O)-methylase SpoU
MYNKKDYPKKLFAKQLKKNAEMATHGKQKFIMILDSLKASFNVGKIYRSAEVFGVHEIHLINVPYFDPVPAKGTLKRVVTHFWDNFDSCYQNLQEKGYSIYALDVNESNYMHKVDYPEKSAFIVGNEGFGVQFDLDKYPEINRIKIQQFGLTESLNVSVAATLSMYEYSTQHGFINE